MDNDEEEKFLFTFQNLLNNITKLSSEIVIFEKVIVMCEGKDILESRNTCSNLLTLFTNTINE